MFVFAFSQALVKPRKQKGGRGDGERKRAATLCLRCSSTFSASGNNKKGLGRYLSAARDVHVF